MYVHLLGGAPELALVQPPEGPGRALGVSLKPIRAQYCGQAANERRVLLQYYLARPHEGEHALPARGGTLGHQAPAQADMQTCKRCLTMSHNTTAFTFTHYIVYIS